MRPYILFFFSLSQLMAGFKVFGQTSDRGLAVEPKDSVGQRWAVIIGVNYYQDNRIGSLSYAVPDALLIRDALVEGGYPAENVRLICDSQDDPALKPNAFNIQHRLDDWLKFAGPNDTVVVYFSGHGFLDQSGQGFLAPLDCDISNLADSSVSISSLNASLQECKARRRLLLLDCCRDIRSKGVESGTSGEELAKAFDASEGLITIASCRQEQKSYESEELKHGFFTWYLAEALQGHADTSSDGIVDSNELYAYVWQKVTHAATRQHKQQSPVEIKHEVSGIFPIVNVLHPPRIISPDAKQKIEKPALPAVAMVPVTDREQTKTLIWFYAAVPVGIVVAAVYVLWPRRKQPKTVVASGGRQRNRISNGD